MYAEMFGIEGADQAVEAAATWVQWAQAGIAAGAAENESTIRYNLDQFWRAKAAAYPNEDSYGQAQLDRLDVFAHGFWQALETGKTFSTSPSFWQFFKSYYFGGTPERPEAAAAAANAAAAAAKLKDASTQAGGTFGTGMNTLANQWQANVPAELNAANANWKQTGVTPLGIPLWAWIAGAAALALLVFMPKGK